MIPVGNMLHGVFRVENGTGMLLASDRPNGQNLQPSGALFHGDTALATDLYFIPYTQNGWGAAVNLGVTVAAPSFAATLICRPCSAP